MKDLIKNNQILISFSGGRTSAFMTLYLKTKYPDKDFNIIYANTGKERAETLDFINECDERWGLGVTWIEATFSGGKGERGGNGAKVVTYETAARKGEPFEEMLKKYGIPNMSYPHCTRELKKRAIDRYMKSIGITDFWSAIGIRADEAHRINRKTAASEQKFYPLTDSILVDKHFIRSWWDRQPFDLRLKDYEGNCDMCWKKSDRKIFTLLAEQPDLMDWWIDMEKKYSEGKYYFFRKNRSGNEMIEDGKKPFHKAKDDKPIGLFEATDGLDIEYDCFCKST